MQTVAGDPHTQRAVVAIDAQDTGFADELDEVAARSPERVEAFHLDVVGQAHPHVCRVLLARVRGHACVGREQLAADEPRHEIHVVCGEVEQDAAAARDPPLPFRHRVERGRLAERRLAGDDPANRAVGHESASLREERVVSTVEADRSDHSRTLGLVDESFAFGDTGRQRLLEVEMLACLNHCEGERRVLVRPGADDDRVDVLSIDRGLRIGDHVDAGDTSRSLPGRRGRISGDDELHVTRPREHPKVHGARDRPTADERHTGLQGFTRVA